MLFTMNGQLINADCTFCPENDYPHKIPDDGSFMLGFYIIIALVITGIAFFGVMKIVDVK
jgi:hypothetical protein